MRCATYVAEGLESRVFPHDGVMTLVGWQPFYDERGVYHSHNPNTHNCSYSCSNGHKWHESHSSRCPADGCDWAVKALKPEDL